MVGTVFRKQHQYHHRNGENRCLFLCCQVTNGSSSSEMKTAEVASSDDPLKTTPGGSTLRLHVICRIFICKVVILFVDKCLL